MGFMSLVIIFCWPLFFMLAAFAAFLIGLNTALNVVVTIMLVANLAFLILLLFLRTKWKATGRMEPEFINSYEGWRHYGLLAAKGLLTGGMVWEAIVVAICALLLLFHPWSVLLI